MIDNFDVSLLLKPQIQQANDIAEAIIKGNFAHDASGTGQGKTYVASAVLRHLKRKFVIISPRLNIPKWRDVLAKFGLKAELIINYEKLARGNLKKYYRYKVKGCSKLPYFLRGEFRLPKDWIVVCDESHRMKGIESLSAGFLYALKNQGYTTYCMSATQAMTPLDMRAFGYIAGLHKGMHTTGGRGQNFGMNLFKAFAHDAGAEFTGSYGAMYFNSEKPESVKKLQEVRRQLFEVKKVSFRMRREDFGDIFPRNQIEATAYDMGENGKKIAQVYHDMQRELAQLEENSKNYKDHVLAIITKARRMAELLKVPALEELVEEQLDEGRSSLVFVNFTDTIEALNTRLAKKLNKGGKDLIAKIYGGQTERERFADIDAFQSDKKRVTLANLAAGAEAIDLHDITGKYPRTNNINPSFRAISVVQSIGRPDRAYAKSDVITNLVLADGTIEVSVATNFNHKKGHLDILNDGDLIPHGPCFRFAAGEDV